MVGYHDWVLVTFKVIAIHNRIDVQVSSAFLVKSTSSLRGSRRCVHAVLNQVPKRPLQEGRSRDTFSYQVFDEMHE